MSVPVTTNSHGGLDDPKKNTLIANGPRFGALDRCSVDCSLATFAAAALLGRCPTGLPVARCKCRVPVFKGKEKKNRKQKNCQPAGQDASLTNTTITTITTITTTTTTTTTTITHHHSMQVAVVHASAFHLSNLFSFSFSFFEAML